jgi:hypothetical protein
MRLSCVLQPTVTYKGFLLPDHDCGSLMIIFYIVDSEYLQEG